MHNIGRELWVARPYMAQVLQAGNAEIGTSRVVVTLKKNWYTVTVDGLRAAYSTVDGMYNFPGTLYFGVNRITGGTYRSGSGLCGFSAKWLCKCNIVTTVGIIICI